MSTGLQPRTAVTWTALTLRDPESFAALRAEWTDLARRCPSATPFQAHGWLSSWWRTYGRAGRLRVVLVRRDGVLVAAAALHLVRHWGCAVLRPLGGDLSDFGDVLVDAAVAREAGQRLVRAVTAVRGWRVLDLPETRPDAAAAALAWPGARRDLPASRCFELPATTMDTLVGGLPAHTRKTVRRRVNQLAKLGVDVRAVAPQEADRAVADLLRLHAAQWEGRGVNPAHVHPDFARHLTGAVRDMVADDAAALLEYRLDGVLVAANLVVIGRDLVGGYLYGAEPRLRERLDVTTMLIATTLPVALERGRATVSMLRGAEPHKARWRPTEVRNRRLLLVRPASIHGRAYAAGAATVGAAVELARVHAPGLRTVRDRLRALGGRRGATPQVSTSDGTT